MPRAKIIIHHLPTNVGQWSIPYVVRVYWNNRIKWWLISYILALSIISFYHNLGSKIREYRHPQLTTDYLTTRLHKSSAAGPHGIERTSLIDRKVMWPKNTKIPKSEFRGLVLQLIYAYWNKVTVKVKVKVKLKVTVKVKV